MAEVGRSDILNESYSCRNSDRSIDRLIDLCSGSPYVVAITESHYIRAANFVPYTAMAGAIGLLDRATTAAFHFASLTSPKSYKTTL